jgi:hypothetical protein
VWDVSFTDRNQFETFALAGILDSIPQNADSSFRLLETVRAITRSVPVAGRCFGHAAQIEIFHKNRSVLLGQSDSENPIPLSAPAIKLVR